MLQLIENVELSLALEKILSLVLLVLGHRALLYTLFSRLQLPRQIRRLLSRAFVLRTVIYRQQLILAEQVYHTNQFQEATTTGFPQIPKEMVTI